MYSFPTVLLWMTLRPTIESIAFANQVDRRSNFWSKLPRSTPPSYEQDQQFHGREHQKDGEHQYGQKFLSRLASLGFAWLCASIKQKETQSVILQDSKKKPNKQICQRHTRFQIISGHIWTTGSAPNRVHHCLRLGIGNHWLR
jgi:hypothetical protein